MLIPNNSGLLRRKQGYNVNAEILYGPGEHVPCAVIKLVASIAKTNVRTDSSATGSNAEEVLNVSKILFLARTQPADEDLFEIAGMRMRIVASHPRYAVTGTLDHYECDLMRQDHV